MAVTPTPTFSTCPTLKMVDVPQGNIFLTATCDSDCEDADMDAGGPIHVHGKLGTWEYLWNLLHAPAHKENLNWQHIKYHYDEIVNAVREAINSRTTADKHPSTVFVRSLTDMYVERKIKNHVTFFRVQKYDISLACLLNPYEAYFFSCISLCLQLLDDSTSCLFSSHTEFQLILIRQIIRQNLSLRWWTFLQLCSPKFE